MGLHQVISLTYSNFSEKKFVQIIFLDREISGKSSGEQTEKMGRDQRDRKSGDREQIQ